ncbi:MAG: alanine--tRNA ligase [Candidatus Levybacteria bacterium]|nr:alanine--tRNA ligase [Candidatus Levybacteria bacterium]
MTASDILQRYISFFENKEHVRIPNSSLVPQNDPTTLFTSSGMQPLVPYLLGEPHPSGKRLVNVQNCFRAKDIDEVGDNRHTTFFRMLGNWSLGDYFKAEQIPWFWEFLTSELKLPAQKLYVSVFNGFNDIEKDTESEQIWKKIFEDVGLDARERIHFYGVDKNWWSRAGLPQDMPEGEPGGPDTEVFFDFGTTHDKKFGESCNPNCQCGRFLEIGNSVFMQYIKRNGAFQELPNRNVDFGGGLERLLAVVENQNDIFETSLLSPVIKEVEKTTGQSYAENKKMRIITDHFVASSFIIANDVEPSNKEQGYILRRLLRRGIDNLSEIGASDVTPILESIASQYKDTDEKLKEKFEKIKGVVLEEQQGYKETQERAKAFIQKKYPSAGSGQVPSTASSKGGQAGQAIGDELMGVTKISAEDAFVLYSTHGLSPAQIKSLGLVFNNQEFARKIQEHQQISRAGATQKFAGGLADHSQKSILGHTATHLLHQALRDILGDKVHQTGSNITSERLRFDFNYDKPLTDDEIKKLEDTVNEKIKENLHVHFEMIPLKKALAIGAIGLFDKKYQEEVKVYFIGEYSKEFCGGPHVNFTGEIKRFNIIKQESIGQGLRRIYAQVG